MKDPIFNNIYLVKWPDGSASILTAHDKVNLFDRIDMEGDPMDCKIYEIKANDDNLHLSFEIKKQGEETFIAVDTAGDYCEEAKLKRVNFPTNIFAKYLSRITGRTLKDIQSNVDTKTMKKEMGIS